MWDFACFAFSVLVFAAGAVYAHRRGELFPEPVRPPRRPCDTDPDVVVRLAAVHRTDTEPRRAHVAPPSRSTARR